MIGIYRITSPTNKIYIGQSWDIERRQKEYSKARCSQQIGIYRSIIKHGWANHLFEVIHLLKDPSQKYLNYLELLEVTNHSTKFKMLNVSVAGIGGKHTIETIDKIKKARALQSPPTLGKFYAIKKFKVKKNRTYWVGKKHKESSKLLQAQKKIGTKHNCKITFNTQTGIYYETLGDAAETIGLTMKNLSNKLRGCAKNKTFFIFA